MSKNKIIWPIIYYILFYFVSWKPMWHDGREIGNLHPGLSSAYQRVIWPRQGQLFLFLSSSNWTTLIFSIRIKWKLPMFLYKPRFTGSFFNQLNHLNTSSLPAYPSSLLSVTHWKNIHFLILRFYLCNLCFVFRVKTSTNTRTHQETTH